MDADPKALELDKDAPRRSMQRLVLAPGVEVWLGDCMAIAPTLQGVDAIISDPPYGMKWDTNLAIHRRNHAPSRKNVLLIFNDLR